MTTQTDSHQTDGTPPAWLLPVLAVVIIGVAALVAVLLTRPPTPQAVAPPTAQAALIPAQPDAAQAPPAAEQAAPVPDHGAIDPNGPAVERIDLAGARARFDAQTAVFVDVRSGQEFTAGHIAGAISLTSPELETRLSALPVGTAVIAYGDAAKPDSAVRAAQIFMDLGYPQVIALDGGWQAWQQVGFPIE